MDHHILDTLWGTAELSTVVWVLLQVPGLALFRQALVALLPTTDMLGGYELTRAKFKPGRKLSAYYDLTLFPQHNSPSRRAIGVTWEPPAKLQPTAPDLDNTSDRAIPDAVAAPFQRLSAEIAEWGMRVQVFPLDARFPQLGRLADPVHVREMLASVTGIDTERAPQYAVTPIRYRPGQRHVLRYMPLDNAGQPIIEQSVFAKLYKRPADGARAFRVASQVADLLATANLGVSAVRPLAFVDDDALIVYPFVSGRPLSALIRQSAPEVPAALRRIGSALRTLHAAPPTSTADLLPHTFAEEIVATARAGEHVNALLPHGGAQMRAVLDQLETLHERIPQEALTFVHGDLKADHFFATPHDLALIDFDTCYLADPALDLGKFLADLEWSFASIETEQTAAAQAEFLAGYGADVPPERLLRARLYQTLILLKITVHRVALVDPNWADRTERLITRAATILDTAAGEIAA